MSTSKKEKENQAIKLADVCTTTNDITKEVHISLKDIGEILDKATGNDLEFR